MSFSFFCSCCFPSKKEESKPSQTFSEPLVSPSRPSLYVPLLFPTPSEISQDAVEAHRQNPLPPIQVIAAKRTVPNLTLDPMLGRKVRQQAAKIEMLLKENKDQESQLNEKLRALQQSRSLCDQMREELERFKQKQCLAEESKIESDPEIVGSLRTQQAVKSEKMESIIGNQNLDIARLKQRLKETNAQISRYRTKISNFEASSAKLSQTFDDLNEKYQDASAYLVNSNKKLKREQRRRQEAESKLQELASREKKIEMAETMIKSILDENESLSNLSIRMQSRSLKYQQERDEASRRCDLLQGRLSDFESFAAPASPGSSMPNLDFTTDP